MRPAGRLLASTMLTATFGLANPDDVFEPLRIDAFADGAAAVVFFLPDQCPACELLAGWASKDYDLDVPLYFVSSAPVAELASWSSRHPNLAVVHDEQSAWGEALGVTEVPSVFILSDGNVINADYWPFFGGLEGLQVTIEMSYGLGHADVEHAVDFVRLSNMTGYDASDRGFVIGDLEIPASFILCSPTCPACSDEAQWLVDNGLPPPTYVLMVAPASSPRHATPWEAIPGISILHLDAETLGPAVVPLHFRLGTGFVVEEVLVGFSPEPVRRFLTSTGGIE